MLIALTALNTLSYDLYMLPVNPKKLYHRTLRTLNREALKLDKKSMAGDLSSAERLDLIRILKALEVKVPEMKRQSGNGMPSDALVKRAEEIIRKIKNGQETGISEDTGEAHEEDDTAL